MQFGKKISTDGRCEIFEINSFNDIIDNMRMFEANPEQFKHVQFNKGMQVFIFMLYKAIGALLDDTDKYVE
jgi:hypothetical protein